MFSGTDPTIICINYESSNRLLFSVTSTDVLLEFIFGWEGGVGVGEGWLELQKKNLVNF